MLVGKQSVSDVYTPVTSRREPLIVGYHDQCFLFLSGQSKQQFHDRIAVSGVEISDRLVCENDCRIIDQSPRNGDTLLFSAGHLAGQMIHPMAQTDAL